MPDRQKAGNLFIVDNADDEWKVQEYLRQWAEISRAFDVATGYFEIGALELELPVKMSPAPVSVTMVLSPAGRSDSGVA